MQFTHSSDSYFFNMSFPRLLSLILMMTIAAPDNKDEHNEGESSQMGAQRALSMLDGDQEESTFTDEHGIRRCNSHHDDWDDIDWQGADRPSRGRHLIYHDMSPNVSSVHPWLLMEPASHEISNQTQVHIY